MPSEQQIGIMGQYEPELCAVSGRPVRGKHAVTHYQGDNVHYVRVLNQFDHLWPQAAPAYGFPVPEEKPAQEENVFVLNTDEGVLVPTGDNGVEGSFQAGSFPAGNFASVSPIASRRTPKPTSSASSDIKADGMSKGDD